MRIECGTIETFIDELAIEAEAERVHKRIVRWRVDRNPEQAEAVTFVVCARASVLLGDPDTGPTELLHADVVAGRDSSRGNAGTQQADDWHARLKTLCDQFGLKLRSGKFEMV